MDIKRRRHTCKLITSEGLTVKIYNYNWLTTVTVNNYSSWKKYLLKLNLVFTWWLDSIREVPGTPSSELKENKFLEIDIFFNQVSKFKQYAQGQLSDTADH